MGTVPHVDGYSDLIEVAQGGFGIVYRGRQDRFGRVVALKVLSVGNLEDRDRQRFERECLAMGGLSWHPNVVAVYDSGITIDGHPFLTMEFLGAGSLADLLRAGPLSWQEAVAVGVQVAGALDVAHAAGTLHRDLKPENLLIGPYGEVKLGDFGIAAAEGGARTTTGHASFTVDHVAPELLRGERPDERTDLYGLASTLHTLIAGAPPFASGRHEPIAEQMMRVLQEPPPRLPGIPEPLADLLVRGLAKDPAQRPTSAEELGRRLQRIQVDSGVTVTDLRLAPRDEGGVRSHSPRCEGGTSPGTSPQGDSQPTVRHVASSGHQADPRPTIRLPATPETDPHSAFPDKAAYQFLSDEHGEVFDEVWAAYVSNGRPLIIATPVLREACIHVIRGTSPASAVTSAMARSKAPTVAARAPRTPASRPPAPPDSGEAGSSIGANGPRSRDASGAMWDKVSHEFLRDEWGDVFDEVWAAYEAQGKHLVIATPVLRDACRQVTKGAAPKTAVSKATARARSIR